MIAAKKSVLLISFEFPPDQSSSGVLRVASFARTLSDTGWQVNVLSSKSQTKLPIIQGNIPLTEGEINVTRTWALDAAQDLSIGGKYPACFEWPDRYSTWVLSALVAGIRLIRQRRIKVIYSTYPIASAHVIAYLLSKFTNIPWIAEFRDPMIMASHPATESRRRAHEKVEKLTIGQCARVIVTTDGTKDLYLSKYPILQREKISVIENGYDESILRAAREKIAASSQDKNLKGEIRILHSGVVYPDHRDPTIFFQALAKVVHSESWRHVPLRVVFRGNVDGNRYSDLLESLQLNGAVVFKSPTSYVEAVTEMMRSDGLLLIQGSSCNRQIPAKLYEYLRVDKPILAVTPLAGETAKKLISVGIKEIAFQTEVWALANTISRFLTNIDASESEFLATADLGLFDRRLGGQRLSNIFAECT